MYALRVCSSVYFFIIKRTTHNASTVHYNSLYFTLVKNERYISLIHRNEKKQFLNTFSFYIVMYMFWYQS